jgi:D-amino-acid oxidase
VRSALANELPTGYDRGWVLRVPLVEMPAHLKALQPARVVRREVRALNEIPGLVVNCTGLAARELADDPTVAPARGQVVRLTRMAGVPCVCDEDRMIYVLPRSDCTIVGGSYQPGNERGAVDPEETALLLARTPPGAPQSATGSWTSERSCSPGRPRQSRGSLTRSRRSGLGQP